MMPFGYRITVCVLILTIFGPLGSMGQNCGGTLNKHSPTRNFTSPNYPGPLGDEITCDWIIEAPMGQVHLQFEEFNFAPSLFGCSDFNAFISIYDGTSTSAPSLGRYCGDENGNFAPPDVIQSSSGSLLVSLYSGDFGGLLPGQGFAATFYFPEDGVDHCASSPCLNGGTCVNTLNGFQCLCTPEFVGTQCHVSSTSCLLPLGMASGSIEDSQISASTEKTGYEAYKGRLNGPRAWQADVANTNQWLQVNFTTRTIITGIQTQGLWGGHVKSYKLLYGDAEDDLSTYQETGLDSDKVFDANSDGVTVVSHDLDVPIVASIVRVNPQDFTGTLIRLRMELMGCADTVSFGSTQPGTTPPGTTSVMSTSLSTSQAITTDGASTVVLTTPPLSTPDRSTTQPAITTTSATIQPTLPPSTQSSTTEMQTTSLSQTPTSVTTATTPNLLTPSTATVQPTETPVTPSFMTPGPSTIITLTTSTEETVVTTSETFVVETSETPQVTTLEPSTVSTSTTNMEETVLTTTETSNVETSETPSVTTSTVSTSTSPMSEETVTTTTTASTSTASTTAATSTTLMVETTETTTVAPTTTPVATTDAETTKVTVASQPTTTSLQIVESSPETTNVKTSVHTTKEAFTSRKTDMPLLVETTKPDLIKTTESLWKYTTTAEDGDKEAQTGDSGGGGNTAVFAAAGAAGGVAVLVGVGVTVFICRRRGRNSEACGVPMHRLEENNNPKTHNHVADVEVENPLYGTMSKADEVGLAVADSCA